MSKVCVLLGSLMLLMFCQLAQAHIVYRWVDEKGAVHYSPMKPWGVKYEEVNTAFSANEREIIENIKKEKAQQYLLENQDKIAAQDAQQRKNKKVQLELCIESAFDKVYYQRRRVEDESLKQKIDCEYKFNKVKQKTKYDSCILQVESNRLIELNKLDKVAADCFSEDTPPEVIEVIMEKYRQKTEEKLKQ
jgi:hypothetical protein